SAVLRVLNLLTYMSSLALCLYALQELYTHFVLLIHAEIASPAFWLALINLLSQSFLLSLGILGVVSFTPGIVLDVWVGMVISTCIVSLSLLSYFYEKTHIPESKIVKTASQEVPMIKKELNKDNKEISNNKLLE